ncbi:MAG: short-chain dehydrogenase [Magnetovibrio sp.]|nr:short-chain dehydrogenase [Magnetovibrio sp.]
MSTVMITGSNRGIGLEFTRQYAADGWTVIATCRNPIQPGELSAIPGDIQVHGLDVSDQRQVDRLAADLKDRSIDILINNAGIFGPRNIGIDNMDYQAWTDVIGVNTLSPLRISSAFIKHVAQSEMKKIITISSIMGSISKNDSGGEYIYRSSKAAVNMVMRSFAHSIDAHEITVAMFHPGWVKTDMGGESASIDVKTSVSGLRSSIAGLNVKDTGSFFNYDGEPLPW